MGEGGEGEFVSSIAVDMEKNRVLGTLSSSLCSARDFDHDLVYYPFQLIELSKCASSPARNHQHHREALPQPFSALQACSMSSLGLHVQHWWHLALSSSVQLHNVRKVSPPPLPQVQTSLKMLCLCCKQRSDFISLYVKLVPSAVALCL